MRTKDNCWICEGWQEIKFDIRTTQSGLTVYLHISFDDYKADRMTPISNGLYSSSRMVPPGMHKYFFSVKNESIFNSLSPQVLIDEREKHEILEKLEKHTAVKFNITKVNYVESQFRKEPWIKKEDGGRYEIQIKNCQPRPDKRISDSVQERPRTPWTFPISLFKDYRLETD